MPDRDLYVTQDEWKKAKALYKKHRKNFIRKDEGLNHNFIVLNDTLYAMANTQGFFADTTSSDKKEGAKTLLGKGAFGTVVVGMREDGAQFAIKEQEIKRADLKGETNELKILGLLGRYEGSIIEDVVDNPKKVKQYIVQELHEGKNLSVYASIQPKVDPKINLQVAIKVVKAILDLHNHNVLHNDIKPDNMMWNVDGDMLTVTAIDFNVSKILREGATQYHHWSASGSPAYMAPEVATWHEAIKEGKKTIVYDDIPGKQSKASDVYSLGVMLEKDFKLGHLPIVEQMLEKSRHKRPPLSKVLQNLENLYLETYQQDLKSRNLDINQLKQLNEFFVQYQEKQLGANKGKGRFWSHLGKKASTQAQLALRCENIIDDYVYANHPHNSLEKASDAILKELISNLETSLLIGKSSFNAKLICCLPDPLKKEVCNKLHINMKDLAIGSDFTIAKKTIDLVHHHLTDYKNHPHKPQTERSPKHR